MEQENTLFSVYYVSVRIEENKCCSGFQKGKVARRVVIDTTDLHETCAAFFFFLLPISERVADPEKPGGSVVRPQHARDQLYHPSPAFPVSFFSSFLFLFA